jgi:hypothetical protein
MYFLKGNRAHEKKNYEGWGGGDRILKFGLILQKM